MNTSSRSIIISGPPAVGKTTLAKAISEKFNLRHYGGGDVLKEIAAAEGHKPSGNDWWDSPDGMNFLEKRKIDYSYDKMVDNKLMKIASDEHAVITSYTLPWLYHGGTKFWLNASSEERVKRLAQRDNLSHDDARVITKCRDSGNQELYEKLYNFTFAQDLSVFDFALNTDKFSQKELTDVVFKILEYLL